MPRRISVEEYFQGPETLRPMELAHGIVREPPAPRYGHQSLVTRTTVLLDQHVRQHGLGTVRVWGAPDLVVEVLSRRTAVRDQTQKLGWYRQYGVGECWFIDPKARTVEIVDCASMTVEHQPLYERAAVVQSRVLPALRLRAEEFFE